MEATSIGADSAFGFAGCSLEYSGGGIVAQAAKSNVLPASRVFLIAFGDI